MAWLLFIMGLMFGSFYNVLIWRIPRHESIISPGSYCPSCRHRLRWWELIPIASYIVQRGVCKECGAKISIRYPMIELLTGIAFLIFYQYADSWQTLVVSLVFVSLLIVAGTIDIRHKLLPNIINFPGLLLGLVFAGIRWSIPLIDSLYGILVGGGILLVIALLAKGGMGMGDVKLIALIGAYMGPVATLITLFLASFLGAFYGIVYLIITKKDRKKATIPFGPFLAIGSICAYFYYYVA